MYVFNFSYNYLTIIRIGPLPLGILQLRYIALGSSTGAYLINVLLTYYVIYLM